MKQNFNNKLLFAEIAALLKNGQSVTVPVKGDSMSPFWVSGRDFVTLQRCDADRLRPGDVVLARENKNGNVVLHRIIAKEGNWLTLQGDGNPQQTEQADIQDVAGIVVSFTRKNKSYEVTGYVWRIYSFCRMKSAFCRRLAGRFKEVTDYIRSIVRGYKSGISLICLTGILSVVLSLLFIYLSKQMIDAATEASVQEEIPVWHYALALILTMLLQLLCDAADRWNSVRVQVKMGNSLRHRLFARLLRSEWNGLEHFHTGDVVNRMERDTSSLVSLLAVSFPSFAIMGIQFLSALAFFCYLDTWLPLIVIGVFPVLLSGSRFYLRRMYHYTHKIRQSDSHIQSVIQESLQQRTILKALEQDERHICKLDEQQRLFRIRFMRRARFSISSRTCISAAFACGYLIAFLWGVAGLKSGSITFGVMAAFLQLVNKVQRPILDMARLVPSISEAWASIDRLRELEKIPVEDKSIPVRFSNTPDVVVNDITFRYVRGDRPVLHHFSCRFKAGSRVAVTGETGQGKTTLIRLLLALAVPQEGTIRLCSPELAVPVSPETRCNFTYVPQGNILFSGTIRENLLMGNPHASESDMRKALHTAVADFVFLLPDGMNSLIGEQANGLSEGQAQRIAIARALLRDSHIFLLDEATSALDEATERELMENLDAEYKGRTFIFITHHAAIAARCEQIVRI